MEIRDQKWFGRFYTIRDVQVQAGVVAGKPDPLPGIYQRGMDQRNPEFADALRQTHVEPVQYVGRRTSRPRRAELVGRCRAAATCLRRRRAAPCRPARGGFAYSSARRRADAGRSGSKTRKRTSGSPSSSQGVTMVIEGLTVPKGSIPGVGGGPMTLDISHRPARALDHLAQPARHHRPLPQDENQPMEIYMEGNVVFRQGDRIIYADRMYYDVRNHVGTVLAADMLTPAPGYEGKVHIHADVMQEVGPRPLPRPGTLGHFQPTGRSPLSLASRANSPTTTMQTPQIDPITGDAAGRSPTTGQPESCRSWSSGQNNLVYIENVPVFWWPTFATDLNDPSFFIRGVRFKDDGVFGYSSTSISPPTSCSASSSRPWAPIGPSASTISAFAASPRARHTPTTAAIFSASRARPRAMELLGHRRPRPRQPGPRAAERGARAGRQLSLLDHRPPPPGPGRGLTFTAEVGKISDRNFLLEYFKSDWDEQKDPTTDIDLKLRRENVRMEFFAQDRLDNFVTETNWLPRADHFLLGESLLGDHLTWFEHTSVGYAQFKVATLPSAAAGDEATSHLPWEPQNFSGGRFVSRNEIDLPLELGPVKIVPYVLGEIGYWGEDLNGQDLTRAYYQAGIRATLPMWAVDSEAESELVERSRAGPQGRVPGGIPARAIQRRA